MSAQSVEDLLAAGDYAAAARAARDGGDFGRAAELYERIWEFRAAADCARAAGDMPRALRNAIDARDETLVRELIDALVSAGEAGARAAIDALAARRRWAAAAEIAERIGDIDRAIELFRHAHRDVDAARLLEQIGRDRDAGQLLERLVAHGGDEAELAPAHLALGRLLARRLQHDDAIAHLQRAARHPTTRAAARRQLIVELAALGLRDAARDVLVATRAEDGANLPATLDAALDALRDAAAAPASAARAGDPSQLIGGRYRTVSLLGAGGSGRVFLATDEVTGRRVAVKLLNAAPARGRDAYARFAREAQIARALHHPNLVEILDFSVDQGYLVMEYLSGGSLAQHLAPKLAEPRVRRMALDILAGLELAHRRNIVHRDIKPPNIFFDARGTAKLGDFGVAHLLDLGATQTGGLIGTLAYMSPEQITGAPLTFAADLYALGVTLYQALTGRLPFVGPDFVAQHLGEPPPRASEIAPDLGSRWDAILARLLEKNPADRFDSVDALRRAIAALPPASAAPLVLPRAPRREADDAPREAPPATTRVAQPGDDAPRYAFDTLLDRTATSTLRRAVDRALDRSVILEQFDAPLSPAAEARLFALARGGGPYLQRALAYDRAKALAVFEAPAGAPLASALAGGPLSPRAVARLVKRLARAVVPLHRAATAHGAVSPASIVIDDHGYPTLLVAGHVTPPPDAVPADDVAAIIALACEAAGAVATDGDALVDALAGHLSPPEQSALRLLATPRAGDDLYALADALEIAVLEREMRR